MPFILHNGGKIGRLPNELMTWGTKTQMTVPLARICQHNVLYNIASVLRRRKNRFTWT